MQSEAPLVGADRPTLDGRIGAYQSHDIAWVDGADFEMAEELYLTVVPDGRAVLLKDTARLIWLAARAGGDVVAQVAAWCGVSPADIGQDVSEFLQQLVERGLLERRPPSLPSIPTNSCSCTPAISAAPPTLRSSPALSSNESAMPSRAEEPQGDDGDAVRASVGVGAGGEDGEVADLASVLL